MAEVLYDDFGQIIEEPDTMPIPDNYIYISHLDNINGKDFRFWLLPFWPDSITDTMQSTFTDTSALGRSAPVFTYSHSGPRTVQIEIELHRDMMNDMNFGRSNVELATGEDYVTSLIHALQSISVPRYNLDNKAVEPPLVALRVGNDIFIKGVVTSSIGITYQKPILSDNRYAQLKLSLQISEVDPYSAEQVFQNGSFRGRVKSLIPPWYN